VFFPPVAAQVTQRQEPRAAGSGAAPIGDDHNRRGTPPDGGERRVTHAANDDRALVPYLAEETENR